MSNEQPPATFQEPKQVNTVALLTQRNHIKWLIDHRFHNDAFQEMCSLVCEFELTVKDVDMLKVKELLMGNYSDPQNKGIPPFEDMEFFAVINDYMNATYLKGFRAPMGEEFFKDLEEDGSSTTES